MRRLLLIGILFFSIRTVFAQQILSFPTEYIDFTLDEPYFSVNGIYTFMNNSEEPVAKTILFPFSINTSFIDSIRVINLNKIQEVIFLKHQQDITFNISVPASDSVQINIFYHQPLALINSYILTSAKTWNAPLKKAVYTLTVNRDIKVKSFSIIPDSQSSDSINYTYFWEKFNFNPEVDFIIYLE